MSDLLFGILAVSCVVNALVIYIAVRRFTARNIAEGNLKFDYRQLQDELAELRRAAGRA